MIDSRNKFIKKISELTFDRPAFIHLDMLGLKKLAADNASRLTEFSKLLEEIEKSGGNICIPSYTLSYTRNEEYDMNKSPVINAGIVSESVRRNFPAKRTVDGLFSYIVFGNKISHRHFEVHDYNSFGRGSLIEEVFDKDGYIWTIGGVFKNSTEIHFIEREFKVDYRDDKVFKGVLIDTEGRSHRQDVTFFCKNFDYRYWYDFKAVENDMRSEGIMETIKQEGFPVFISGVKFRTLFDFLKKKIETNKRYVCRDLHFKNS